MQGEKEKDKFLRNKKKEPTPQELLKFEIAKELGLWEKIEKWGWAELSAEESGRIGGIMTKRMRQGKSSS